MEINIIPAGPRHLDELVELEKQCFSDPWGRNILESRMNDERSVFLVAEDENGAAAGYLSMSWVLDEGYINNVAAAPTHRRCGVGDKLLDALWDRARALSLSFLTLEVRVSNAPAIALYKKHGYRPAGIRRGYYDSPKEDALLMTLFLK